MKELPLAAAVRKERGKQACRHLRKEGFVPGVVYRHGKDTVSLKVNAQELHHVLHTEHGENVVIALNVAGETRAKGKGRLVMVKEVQHEPLHGEVLHIDFHEISLTEKLKVDIPIETKGEPVGVKQDGGVLEHIMREVEAECLPTQIPDYIEIDVSALKIGDLLHIRDLVAPEGVKILSDPEQAILAVHPPHVEKVKEAAPEEEAAEPEVITERKAEEGEAAGEGEEGKEKKAGKEEKEEKQKSTAKGVPEKKPPEGKG